MTPLFDLRTIFFVGTCTAATGALTFLALQHMHRSATGALRTYGASMLAIALGLGLLSFRDTLPQWVGIGLSNAMLATGAILTWQATRLMFGRTGEHRGFAVLLVANTLFWISLSVGSDSVETRVMVMAALQVGAVDATGAEVLPRGK